MYLCIDTMLQVTYFAFKLIFINFIQGSSRQKKIEDKLQIVLDGKPFKFVYSRDSFNEEQKGTSTCSTGKCYNEVKLQKPILPIASLIGPKYIDNCNDEL